MASYGDTLVSYQGRLGDDRAA